MRILITGASGFLGAQLTRAMVTAGHDVVALTRARDIPPRLRGLEERITLASGELADTAAIRAVVAAARPEVCLHLAWYAEPGKYLSAPENLPALKASLELVEILAAAGCRRVVGAGTCAEYDTDAGFLREEGATRPATLYAAAKLSLCLLGEPLAKAAGMSFAWARIFYPYGPGEDERRLVAAAIGAVLDGRAFAATPGEQVRDYLHVTDVAAAFRVLAECDASGVFNVASGVPVTVRHLLETVGRVTGRPELIRVGALPYRAWEPMMICGNVSRLKALGWVPSFALESGLEDTVSWWRRRRT